MWFNSFFIRLLTPGNLEPTTGTTTNTQHELSTSSASENGVTYAMSRLRVSTRKWRGVLRCRGCYAGRCFASTAVLHLIFEKKAKKHIIFAPVVSMTIFVFSLSDHISFTFFSPLVLSCQHPSQTLSHLAVQSGVLCGDVVPNCTSENAVLSSFNSDCSRSCFVVFLVNVPVSGPLVVFCFLGVSTLPQY